MNAGVHVLALPYEVADELLADGVAERPVITRGDTLNHIIGIIVDGIDSGAALITLGAAGMAAKCLAASLIARIKKQDQLTVRIRFVSGGKTHEHLIELDDPDAEARLLEAIIKVLEESPPAGPTS